MPCFDGRERPEEVRKDAFDEFRHNSPVAEMLCSAIKVFVRPDQSLLAVPGLAEWWKEHQQRDAAHHAGTREFWDGLFRARVALLEGVQYQVGTGEYLIAAELLDDAGRVPPIGPMASGRYAPARGAEIITTDKWLEPVTRPLHGL